jgi:hypothetical protein
MPDLSALPIKGSSCFAHSVANVNNGGAVSESRRLIYDLYLDGVPSDIDPNKGILERRNDHNTLIFIGLNPSKAGVTKVSDPTINNVKSVLEGNRRIRGIEKTGALSCKHVVFTNLFTVSISNQNKFYENIPTVPEGGKPKDEAWVKEQWKRLYGDEALEITSALLSLYNDAQVICAWGHYKGHRVCDTAVTEYAVRSLCRDKAFTGENRFFKAWHQKEDSEPSTGEADSWCPKVLNCYSPCICSFSPLQ